MLENKVIVKNTPEFRINLNMPEDVEKQRKNFVFGSLFRRRIEIQTVKVKQAWVGRKPQSYNEAVFAIDTRYGSYADDQLIKAGIVSIGTNKLRDIHKTAVTIEDSTLDFIQVSFDGIGDTKSPVRRDAKYMVRECWIIESPKAAEGVAFVFRNKNGKYESLNGAVDNLNTPGYMDFRLKNGSARHYVYFIDSPSGYRQGTVPMIRVPYEHEADWQEWMKHVLNVATGGQFSILVEAHKGNKLPIDKAIKLVGRHALGVTPSTYFGTIDNLAIFCGDYTVETENGKIVPADGLGRVAVQKIQKTFLDLFGYPISRKDAVKFGGQHRINSFIKGHNIVLDRIVILDMIRWMLDNGIAAQIVHLERTREDSVRFEQLKGVPVEKGGFKNCIVVFGSIDEVEYFGDLTCVKSSSDFSSPLELRLMDISHTPHQFIPLSKQGVIQMQLRGIEFEDAYKRIAPAAMDRIFSNTKFEDVDEIIEVETGLDISNESYFVTSIQRLCPQAMQFDAQVKRIALQSVADTVNNRLNRCNLIVRGKYLKLVPDLGSTFGVQLLQDGEFYSPGWDHEEDETGFDAVIIRYPLVDFGAIIKGRAVSFKEMCDRIMATDLHYTYKRDLVQALQSVTTAMIMISSMVPGTTDKLSGADFDGDGACCFTEFEIKRVYVNVKSYADHFGGSKAGDLELEFNYDLGPTSFLYAWALIDETEEPNPAIGIIAGYNVTVSTMLSMLYAGNLDPAQIFHWFLDKEVKGNVIPAQPGSKQYTRLFTVSGLNEIGVDVSFEGRESSYVDEIICAANHCDFSFESAEAFLWDLNAVLSKSMNDTIDAAKNGAKVVVPFLSVIEGRVRSSAVATSDYAKIKLSRSNLKIENVIDVCGSDKSKKEQKSMALLTNDPIAQMKRYLFGMARERLEAALTVDVHEDIQEVSGGLKLDTSLKMLADFYQDLMKADGNNRALAKKQVISMAYALLRRSGIVKPEQILGAVLKASNYVTKDGAAHAYSSFYTQFAELAAHYVQKFCPNAVFSLPVCKFNGGTGYVGQKVTFVNGVSEDGFYVNGRVNGTFCLEADSRMRPIISRRVVDMIPQNEGNAKIAVARLWKQYFVVNGTKVDLDENFNPAQRIAYIEKLREFKDFSCTVKLYDPALGKYVDQPLWKTDLKRVVPMIVSNHGPVGFIQIPPGNSTYLESVLGKQYTIQNVMKMGKDMVSLGIVMEEVG